MIRVAKTPEPPAVLLSQGAARRAEDEARYVAGTREFEFDRRLYSHQTVRRALAAAQRGKCCFCEAKIEHISDGDVEHFRPKAGCRQTRNGAMQRPGYYWLAYEWDNLYFACQLCNQRNKQWLFPLDDPDARVRSHEQADEIHREQPLFIDPGHDEPEALLGYRAGEPFAIDGNVRAATTIRELELGRTHLMERRWELVRILEMFLDYIEAFRSGQIENVEGLLEPTAAWLSERTMADAEFAAVSRCFIRERLGVGLAMPVTAEQLIEYAQGP